MIIPVQTLFFFRHALFAFLHRILRPYLVYITFKRRELHGDEDESDDDDYEEEAYAISDSSKGVVFFPPVYVQRYAAVTDCLMENGWQGKIEKVVELGYHDISFIKYLKEIPGIKRILGVDIEALAQRCSLDLLSDDAAASPDNKLHITLFQGNAADPDYRLIGCDAVIGIEMIEHMLPHDLERLIHTVFGFIKPRIAIFTTPNADFNELFIGLEKNGLRRMDHFFEWSREQFHDWCANIVTRYPEYKVSCRGIGPGPDGTRSLGCCSQMALFESTNYHKQHDLNPNSLALVVDAPPKCITDMDTWDDADGPKKSLSTLSINQLPITNFIYKDPSSLSVLMSKSMMSLESLCINKISQCNLDLEIAKNFMMFDDYDEMGENVLLPRRWRVENIYDIGDVVTRLNCTTLIVKKFSKFSRTLMEKNKRIHAPTTTREIVHEIRCLSEMLEVNKPDPNKPVWNNINWGENAPYWNEYFKVVREYDYPLKMESEESLILDLITDEINSLTEVCQDPDKERLLIPLAKLMQAVAHITTDVDRVRDLLEWNGYVIEDKSVVYHRAPNTDLSLDEGLWTKELAQYESDSNNVQSSALSDITSSQVSSDFGLSINRFLNVKLHELRSMTVTNADFDVALDNVLHRLAKLALRVTKGEKSLQPFWMQRKMYELLSLTEKAIETRRLRFIQNYVIPDHTDDQTLCLSELLKYKLEDGKIDEIEARYKCLIKESDVEVTTETVDTVPVTEISANYNKIQGTEDWVYNDDDDIISKPSFDNIQTTEIKRDDVFKSRPKKRRQISSCNFSRAWRIYQTRIINYARSRVNRRNKPLKFTKKAPRPRGYCRDNTKKTYFCTVSMSKIGKFGHKLKDKHSWRSSTSSASKPIPTSLIKLCHPELCVEKYVKNIWLPGNNEENPIKNGNSPDAEESQIFSIVMDGAEESASLATIAATDDKTDSKTYMKYSKTLKSKGIYNKDGPAETGNDAVYFYDDFNEPSTSKGIRHMNMDAQCGPDVVSAKCSIINCANQDEINTQESSDLSTSMYDNSENAKIYAGIRIKDSLENAKNEACLKESNEITQNSADLITDIITEDLKKIHFDEIMGDSKVLSRKTAGEVQDSKEIKLRCKKSFIDQIITPEPQNKLDRLICDGVQIHSFIDANNSHDIICQGNWQKKSKPRKSQITLQLNKKNKENIPHYRKNDKMLISTTISKVSSINCISKRKGVLLNSSRVKDNVMAIKTDTTNKLKYVSIRQDELGKTEGQTLLSKLEYLKPDNRFTQIDDYQNKDSVFTTIHSEMPSVTDLSILNKNNKEDHTKPNVVNSIKQTLYSVINENTDYKMSFYQPMSQFPLKDDIHILPEKESKFKKTTKNLHATEVSHKSHLRGCVSEKQNQNIAGSKNKTSIRKFYESKVTVPATGTTDIGPHKIKLTMSNNDLLKTPATMNNSENSEVRISITVKSIIEDVLNIIEDKRKVKPNKAQNTIGKCSEGNAKCNKKRPLSQIPRLVSPRKPSTKSSPSKSNLHKDEAKRKFQNIHLSPKINNVSVVKPVLTRSNTDIRLQMTRNNDKNNSLNKNISTTMQNIIVSNTGSEIEESKLLIPIFKRSKKHVDEDNKDSAGREPTYNVGYDTKCLSSIKHKDTELCNGEDGYHKQGYGVLELKKQNVYELSVNSTDLSNSINTNSSTNETTAMKLPNTYLLTSSDISNETTINYKIKNQTVMKSKIDEDLERFTQRLAHEVINIGLQEKQLNKSENTDLNFVKKLSSIIRSKTEGNIDRNKINTNDLVSNVDNFTDLSGDSEKVETKLMTSNPEIVVDDQISDTYMKVEQIYHDKTLSSMFETELDLVDLFEHNKKRAESQSSLDDTTNNLSYTKTQLTHSVVDEVSKNLLYLPIHEKCQKEANYIVFCNEITNNSSMNDKDDDPVTNVLQSTSSTVSTANSVITVKSMSSFKEKTSSDASISSNSNQAGSSNDSPITSKGRILENKKSYKKLTPKSSKKQSSKGFFEGKNKNVFMCQLNLNSLAVQNNNKSLKKVSSAINTKTDNCASTRKRSYEFRGSVVVSSDRFSSCDTASKKARSDNSSISKKRSISRDSFNQEINNSQNSLPKNSSFRSPEESKDALRKNNVAFKNNESTSLNVEASAKPQLKVLSNQCASAATRTSEEAFAAEITSALQNLIDAKVEPVENNATTDIFALKNPNSETLNKNESERRVCGATSSPTDTDGLSYRSITSVSVYSDAYLADNELNSLGTTKNFGASLSELFDKTDQPQSGNEDISGQEFNGFSGNVAQEPDYCNLVDSETGSIAGVSRTQLAISDEVFGAAISSDSFASCLLDDESVVPDWLFAIMTQHHDMNDDGASLLHVPEEPPEDHGLDVNGNMMETGLGLESGAGDGRGMHSQQDSSGQGTLDSSGASSGPHSETILIDPTVNYALLDAIESTTESSETTIEYVDSDSLTIQGRHISALDVSSSNDEDADISSNGTDGSYPPPPLDQ